jgi:hypothetical protein
MGRIRALLAGLGEWWFAPGRRGGPGGALSAGFLAVLLVVGAAHWAGFMDLGRMKLTYEDWPAQHVLLSVMQQGVVEGRVPYHMSTAALGGGTQRFFSIPDVMAFPLLPLLPKMSFGQFLLAHTLLLYAAGFVGLLLIRRRYELSPAAFTLLFLLFNFNGHIVAHLGVGHPWQGYFLLSFFALFVLEMVEGRTDLVVPVKLAVVLTLMHLEGCFHIMVYGLLLLVLLAAFNRRLWKPCLLGVVFTGFLDAFRLLPPAVEYAGGGYAFIGGYRSLWDLFQALAVVKEAGEFKIGGVFGRQGWWEYDLYVGIIGLAAVAYFGIVARWWKGWDLGARRYGELDWPLFLIFVASLSYFWAVVAKLPIPLFNSERCSSRFIIVPFVMLLVIGATRMQGWLDRVREYRHAPWLVALALAELGFELVNHSVRWSVTLLEQSVEGFPFDVKAQIVEKADPLYKAAVQAGGAITLLSAAALVGLVLWARRRAGGAS